MKKSIKFTVNYSQYTLKNEDQKIKIVLKKDCAGFSLSNLSNKDITTEIGNKKNDHNNIHALVPSQKGIIIEVYSTYSFPTIVPNPTIVPKGTKVWISIPKGEGIFHFNIWETDE